MINNISYTILVADDEPNVQSLLKNIFTKEGYRVIIAGNGQEALDVFRKKVPDLIFLDVRMPVLDGLETFKAIRYENQDIMIVMMTAYGTVETAVSAMKMGAFDYITKPFNIEEIKVVAKKALEMRRINAELTVLRQEFSEKYGLSNIICKSSSFREVIRQADLVANNDATVLLRGESGTGKDLLARYMHANSLRSHRPFVKVNCGALPEPLVESELFGHEKGAFTGAAGRKQGKFEIAQGGTLYLDEIGEIPTKIQVKLLHALQYKEIERLGGTETIKTDCRIIAATNKNLEEAIQNKEFREDLFYRLNVIPIFLPALRERKEDIPVLADYFIQSFCRDLNRPLLTIPEETMDILLTYDWPGNIRELENTIERLVILIQDSQIKPQDLPRSIKQSGSPPEILNPNQERPLKDVMDDIEKQIIKRVLQDTGGNRSKAADKLGISRRALHYKLVEYQLSDE